MDIEIDHLPEEPDQPPRGHHAAYLKVVRESDTTLGAPIDESGRRLVCMPSADAIADAIIRRAVAELRG